MKRTLILALAVLVLGCVAGDAKTKKKATVRKAVANAVAEKQSTPEGAEFIKEFYLNGLFSGDCYQNESLWAKHFTANLRKYLRENNEEGDGYAWWMFTYAGGEFDDEIDVD